MIALITKLVLLISYIQTNCGDLLVLLLLCQTIKTLNTSLLYKYHNRGNLKEIHNVNRHAARVDRLDLLRERHIPDEMEGRPGDLSALT